MPNVSRRPWKEGANKPKSRLIATKEAKTTFQERLERKKKLEGAKILQTKLKEDAAKKKEEARKRAEAAKKLKEENRMKSMQVQVVKDVRKIKRMNKKQLSKSRFYLKNNMASVNAKMDR